MKTYNVVNDAFLTKCQSTEEDAKGDLMRV